MTIPPVLIAGMHRSGTSMVAQLLYHCGLSMGSEESFLPKTDENPSGYWEIGTLAKFNDAILEKVGGGWDNVPKRLYSADWLETLDLEQFHARAFELLSPIASDDKPWGWKDPRNSILLPFWRTLYPNLKVIICVRNPLEVAFSMSRRLWSTGTFFDTLSLWRDYYDLLMAKMDQANTIVTHYESYFWSPRDELLRICSFAGLSLESDRITKSIERTISEQQYRSCATEQMLAEIDALPSRLEDLYELFCGMAGDVFRECLADREYQRRKIKNSLVRNFLISVSALDEASAKIASLQQSIVEFNKKYPQSFIGTTAGAPSSPVQEQLRLLQTTYAQNADRLNQLEEKVKLASEGVAILRKSLFGRLRLLLSRIKRLPVSLRFRLSTFFPWRGSHGDVSPLDLFDEDWYLEQRMDVAASGIDSFWHYLTLGWKEGSDPNPYFDVDYYLSTNGDVDAAGIEPMGHYCRHGWKEGRNPNPYFDIAYYLSAYFSDTSPRPEPLAHYISEGWKKGYNPNPHFDVGYYLSENPDVAESGMEPLLHYMRYGWKEARDPSADFDVGWYLARNPDVVISGEEPLAHYIQYGRYEGRIPTPSMLDVTVVGADEWIAFPLNRQVMPASLSEKRRQIEETGGFDREWYRLAYPDVHISGMDPIDHYVRFGAREARNPNPLFNTSIYLQAHEDALSPVDALLHFYESGLPSAPGAYRSPDVLISLQRAYQGKTNTELLTDRRSGDKRFAVFLQCGIGSVHEQWLSEGERPWDLIVNHYDDTHINAIRCDTEFVQNGAVPGTKTTFLVDLMERRQDFIDQYDFVMLLDDDVLIQHDGITRLFLTAQDNSLDLLQASLSEDSYCAHPALYKQSRAGLRFINAVEIMMPILSRRSLIIGNFVPGMCVSGWGVDLVLGELVVGRNFGVAAVSDQVVAEHTKPVDRERGAFYSTLKNAGIYPEVELTYLQSLFKIGRRIVEI